MSDHLNPILDALRADVESLGFTLNNTVLPVLKRKAPLYREESDPPAMITVSKSAAPEQVTRWTFNKKRIDYAIDVTMVSPHSGPEANLPEYTVIRDTLIDRYSKPVLAAAPEVFEMTATPGDFLKPAADRSQWDHQGLVVTASIVTAN